ncbi:MAG: ATP-binding protein [Sphaerochaetaceae bacterium]
MKGIKTIECTVVDNGKGMSEEVRKRVSDPFYTDGVKHTRRKVGLGIPFLIQAVEACGGNFDLQSKKGEGTHVFFSFLLDHIDCPPLGNLATAFVALLSYGGTYQMMIKRKLTTFDQTEMYELDRLQLLDVLGDMHTSGNLQLLKTYVESFEAAVQEIRNPMG